MDIQELTNKAIEFKEQGRLKEALRCYDNVLNALTQEALNYAHAKGGITDEDSTRKILPENLKLIKEYFKQGEDVAKILNNMGAICAELGDYELAKQYFNDAIELIPEGSNYKDPYLGLETLSELQKT
jgi:tetratricopeptide (TPR) repeat protein